MRNKVKLNEIAEVIDSAHKTPTYSQNGYPMVRCTDVRYGNLDLSKALFVDEDVYKEFSRRYKPSLNDIIITRVGSYGLTAKVTDINFCLGQNTSAIKPQKVNPHYLYYVLNSKYVREQIEAMVVGTTQKTLSLKAINNLEIPRLSKDEEGKIAHYLKSLDDKIILNQEMNKTLESMAQAIFTSWFVDFEPFGGVMPNDWRIGTLNDLVIVKYGKDHKKLLEGEYPVYGSGGLMRYAEKALYTKESVLIPRKGTLNNVMYVDTPFWTVDTMFYTEMKYDNIAKYVYNVVKRLDLLSMNAGSAVPSMTTEILNKIEVIIPTKEVLENFENMIVSSYVSVSNKKNENKMLSQLRDVLLSKLMNGEI